MKNALKLLFLKIILVITLIGNLGGFFSFVGDDLKTFSNFTATAGVITGLVSLGLASYIQSRLFPGGKFRGIPNNWDKIYMVREVAHATRDLSIFSLGLAITTRLIMYGLFFGGLSGIFTVGSLIAAKRWHNIFSKLKKRKEKSDIIRSEKHTAQLEEKKSLFKWRFISSSLAATIFAIGALKSK